MQLDVLDHLMTLAGPADRAELLLRLEQDLQKVMADIQMSALREDRKALGAALHVLVGIAGSIGADPLVTLARALGAEAKAGQPLTPALRLQISDGILTLLDQVRRRKSPGGAAA